MNILEELNNYVNSKKAKNIEQQEQYVLEFLDTLDYASPETRKQAEIAVSKILSQTIEQNEVLPRPYAKAMHYLLAKSSLAELGLTETVIHYRERTPKDGNAGAIYSNDDGSITFFNNDVCNVDELLSNTTPPKLRFNYLSYIIHDMQHEIQHAKQFKEIAALAASPEGLNPMNYTMQLQQFARLIADCSPSSKYYSHGGLYRKNHDEFLYELDADVEGATRMLDILKRVSPAAYAVATNSNSTHEERKQKKEKLIAEYNTVTWEHGTNPNQGPVSASHKTSIIIDSIWARLPQKERDKWIGTYPALAITRTKTGKKKTLDEVEKERRAKIHELLKNGRDAEINAEVNKINKLYQAAIEQDALLCFEKQLQHIARTSWNTSRFYINNDGGFSPVDIRAELAAAQSKAEQIASYIEDVDSKSLRAIMDRYTREIMSSKKKDANDVRFFEDKKRALISIESQLFHNKEFKETINQDRLQQAQAREKEKAERAAALAIIKQAFPGFSPTPEIGIMSTDQLILSNNVQEKLQILQAFTDYKISVTKNKNASSTPGFIPFSQLAKAIETIYPFDISPDEKKAFDDILKANPNYARINNIFSTPTVPISAPTSSPKSVVPVVHDTDMSM